MRAQREEVGESSEDSLRVLDINAGKSVGLKRHSERSRWEGIEGFSVPGSYPGAGTTSSSSRQGKNDPEGKQLQVHHGCIFARK